MAMLVLAAPLAACAPYAAISDLETDKVTVLARGDDPSVVMAEARRGCAIHGRVPVQISYRCLDAFCTSREHLFACKE